MNESTAVIVGIGLGIVIGAVGVSCYFSYKRKLKTQEMTNREAINTEQLLNSSEFFTTIDAQNIVDWFSTNITADGEMSCVVAKPTEKVLTGLGCNSDCSRYGSKTLIQVIYDTEKKQASKIRLIEYDNIETNLEVQIDENDGFMVVTL